MPDQTENTERIMRELRQEFMPRESLSIIFENILGTIGKMDARLKDLPNEIAKQLDVFSNQMKHMQKDVAVLQSLRTAERLTKIEEEMEDQKSFRYQVYGMGAALGVLITLLEIFLKR